MPNGTYGGVRGEAGDGFPYSIEVVVPVGNNSPTNGKLNFMFSRLAETELRDALADTPVVLLHGPRQTGKSTLAQVVGASVGASYVSLDDPIPRALAVQDPAGLFNGYSSTLIVDEVQRAPELFLALKSAVDRDRRPGRFLLTGSANVLTLPKLADSLAGRISIIDLRPLAQSEIEGCQTNLIDELFEPEWAAKTKVTDDLVSRIVRGGFPEPYSRPKPNRRDAWFADYIRTLLERDVRDLANIDGLAQMPRLLKLLAIKCGSALNVSDLSVETRIPNTSLHRYLDLLKALFLIFQVPAWSFDEAAKLAKTPKTFLVDTGLVCFLRSLDQVALARETEQFEPILKNFVAAELDKLKSFSIQRPGLFHLRTIRRLEVDFVLETRAGSVVGISVSASPRVLPHHLDGLTHLRDLAGDRFVRGIHLYTGDAPQQLGQKLTALPISALWS
jgi:predicted AAA+ superfamily ATPase